VASRTANPTIRKTPRNSNNVSYIERFVEWAGQHFLPAAPTCDPNITDWPQSEPNANPATHTIGIHSKYADTASTLDQMVCRSVPKS
jgi:hypothetical protein